MNWVFEEFVRVALREALHEHENRFGKGRLDLYQSDTEFNPRAVEPDLMWSPYGAPVFVGDAKYKRITDDNMCNADLYQMLAYIIAANLPSGMLIYPRGKGEAEKTSVMVAHIGRTIEICTLDISAEPRDIRASVACIAARVRAMAEPARQA